MNKKTVEINARKLGVTPEVYLYLCRSGRKMRYFTYDLKREQILIDGEKVVIIPSREDSFDWMSENGTVFATEEKSVEETVMENIEYDILHKAILQLSTEEQWLIEELFFRCHSQREVAKTLGISQPAVKKRCARVINRLKKIMKI